MWLVDFIVAPAIPLTVLSLSIILTGKWPPLKIGELMSNKRMIPKILILIFISMPVLISLLFICVLIPSPINKLLVALDTLILWPSILIIVCLSYRQAAIGKPLMEVKKNFNPNHSITIRMFIFVTFGFCVLLSLMGFLVGAMTPFLKDKAYDLSGAKLISGFAVLAFICSNSIANYYGLRRYHRRNQTRGQ